MQKGDTDKNAEWSHKFGGGLCGGGNDEIHAASKRGAPNSVIGMDKDGEGREGATRRELQRVVLCLSTACTTTKVPEVPLVTPEISVQAKMKRAGADHRG